MNNNVFPDNFTNWIFGLLVTGIIWWNTNQNRRIGSSEDEIMALKITLAKAEESRENIKSMLIDIKVMLHKIEEKVNQKADRNHG